VHEELLDDWAEDQRRHEGEGADQKHGADHQTGEERAGNRKGAGALRNELFASQGTRQARIGTIIANRPKSVARPRVVSYQGALAVRPAKALPLLPVHEL